VNNVLNKITHDTKKVGILKHKKLQILNLLNIFNDKLIDVCVSPIFTQLAWVKAHVNPNIIVSA
jgi:hypothetical protein